MKAKRVKENKEDLLDEEFLRSYFNLLQFVFDDKENLSSRDIETIVIPRLLALKTVVKQFEATNPDLANELDGTSEELLSILSDEEELKKLAEELFETDHPESSRFS